MLYLLNGFGYHTIKKDGTVTKITEDEYSKLEKKDRAYLSPGDGLVSLQGGYYGRSEKLGVIAGLSKNFLSQVAYTKDFTREQLRKNESES
ncbi:MAG: hypothetical protein ACRDF4_11980 [Rhabdochlamydiaceae bacterium]